MEAAALATNGRVHLLDPLGYIEFLGLVAASSVVLTDSGGIQEETTFLGVPCITMREQTERPSTVIHGTNVIVGLDEDKLLRAFNAIGIGTSGIPPLWDGKSAERIAGIVLAHLKSRKA